MIIDAKLETDILNYNTQTHITRTFEMSRYHYTTNRRKIISVSARMPEEFFPTRNHARPGPTCTLLFRAAQKCYFITRGPAELA